jgi:hypothetical protein
LKEGNEKKMFDKIRDLENKIEERDNKMGLLGKGIENLNRELLVREDPIHNSREVIAYLDKFAKYQNEFYVKEMKRQSEQLKAATEESLVFKEELEVYKKLKRDYDDQYTRQKNQIQALNEVITLKDEELKLQPDEVKKVGAAMDSWQKERDVMHGLRKMNRELTNQLAHYKYLCRRLRAGDQSVDIDENKAKKEASMKPVATYVNPRYKQMIAVDFDDRDRVNPNEFLELSQTWRLTNDSLVKTSILKQLQDSTELFESAMEQAMVFQTIVKDSLQSPTEELTYLGLILLTYAVSDPRYGLENFSKLNPIEVILTGFEVEKLKRSKFSVKELQIACLFLLGLYYDFDYNWEDVHSDLFLECNGIGYLKVVMAKGKEVGQLDAIKTIGLIFRSGHLTSELCAVGAVNFLLKNLHGSDPKSKLVAMGA